MCNAQQPRDHGLRTQEGVVALWVTNRERLRAFVQAELLPAWGLAPAAEWFWLKVTARGALVSPLVRDARIRQLSSADPRVFSACRACLARASAP